MRRSLLHTTTLLVAFGVATLWAAPAAQAAGPSLTHGANLVSSPHQLAPSAWHWLRDLWARALCVVTTGSSCVPGSAQGDAGCTMDPGGHCIGSTPPAGVL